MLDVLIIDDSAAIRKILQRVLRQTGLPIGKVLEAGDGAEALTALGFGLTGHDETKTTDAKVGLVLCDINMPNMDGLEFLRTLKEDIHWKDLPVVMVSTEGSQDKVLQAVGLGAAGYVRKPFTAEQIKEKLTSIF
jgi:two-component system chemotaxis response regulator CheY